MVENWSGHLLPEVSRTFRNSAAWHQIEAELLTVAEAQAACDLRSSAAVRGEENQGVDAPPEASRRVATAHPPRNQEQLGRKRGRRPNEERRAALRNEITKYGDAWRDELGEIFKELDRQGVPLGDFHGRKIDLGDGQRTSASKWEDLDLTMGAERSQIIDTLRKYID
jgi:hypothetical protein